LGGRKLGKQADGVSARVQSRSKGVYKGGWCGEGKTGKTGFKGVEDRRFRGKEKSHDEAKEEGKRV